MWGSHVEHVCRRLPRKDRSRGLEEAKDGPSVLAQGRGRAFQRPVQTCGRQGGTEEIQAEGWRGSPALRRSVGVPRSRAGPGRSVDDGQPWAQRLLVFGLWKRAVLQIIRTC